MLPDNFCIFILTHGRPESVHTYDSLMKAGYTGKVFIVIDDEDKTADGYRARFGDKVLQFCKADYAASTDEGDNFQHRKAIVYARNACWELAKQVGCRWFCQMDDDYTKYQIRWGPPKELACKYISGGRIKKRIDGAINAWLEFYRTSRASSLCMAQGGDYIGGVQESSKVRLLRKCMNSWFCDVEKPLQFVGHMNEDVSQYVVNGRRGMVFLTAKQIMLTQLETQTTSGGMSDLYLSAGTYVKSFYTVMAAPSCVQIGLMGDTRSERIPRIHHKINWHNCSPKIIREHCFTPGASNETMTGQSFSRIKPRKGVRERRTEESPPRWKLEPIS